MSKPRKTWKVGLYLIVGVAVLGSSVTMFSGASSSSEIATQQLHTIERGTLLVTVLEQGTLESSDNTEIKCQVRGENTVIEVVESGTRVEPGDVLVRLDTLYIEEQIAERTKYALWTRSGREQTLANFNRSKLAVGEYEEGRFVTELKGLQKDLAIAESNLRTAQNLLAHTKSMAENGYVSQLEVDERTFGVTQAEMAVNLKKTEIDVLKNFTKEEELARLNGDLKAAEARFEAEDERLYADEHRLQRAVDEFEHCVIRAEKSGMVIYPSAAKWKAAPDIEEGATVHKDQVLLLMPDLSRMQVNVGIHESVIDRIHAGLPARVTLADRVLDGKVSSVASVTSPAGWWTGNQVKYDTVIELPSEDGLKPGMSAEVEVIVAEHVDVLTIPVAAVLETVNQHLCWVQTSSGPQRRELDLGDSNDVAIVVNGGLSEGEQVILNPLASVEEAQVEAARTISESLKEPTEESTKESVEMSPSQSPQKSNPKPKGPTLKSPVDKK